MFTFEVYSLTHLLSIHYMIKRRSLSSRLDYLNSHDSFWPSQLTAVMVVYLKPYGMPPIGEH